MGETDGPDYRSELSDRIFRVVAASALALGVGSGGYTLSTTDDRVRKAEVLAELAIRDKELSHLHEQYQDLKKQVERIDRYGPAVGNADLERRISRLESKVE